MKTNHWTERGADISSDGLFRYRLWRQRGRMGSTIVFVMLNPSTADAMLDDPTVRRCVFFAERQDCTRLEIVNLYAFRTPSPRKLAQARDPIGPKNDAVLTRVFDDADVLVFAWGGFQIPGKEERVGDVLFHAKDRSHVRPLCFGLTQDGSPKHPLYQPNVQPLVAWAEPSRVARRLADSQK